LKLINKTVEGKEKKKVASKKRSETMRLKREAIQRTITEKKCACCKEVKPINEFGIKTDAVNRTVRNVSL
jgi:hypothetical protein